MPLVISLFDSKTFATLDDMLCHCQEHCGFDLVAIIQRLSLDYIGAVKLVNFDCLANFRLSVEETLNKRWGNEEDVSDVALDLRSQHRLPAGESFPERYFETYASNEIHEIMLKDQIRTDAYRDFIYGNKHLFAGKVVLDVGCGTGILSMLCAKAGASRVLAVDKSDIIDKARENVFNNGLSKAITCLRGSIEDVVLPVDKVDIIVSEWMGYCLLYEAMLSSVLYARDKYLKPEGLLVPSSATLWIAPVEDQAYVDESVTYWQDVYGFDMRAMQEAIFNEVRVEAMTQASLCGDSFPFKVLDLRSARIEDLEFAARWSSTLNRTVDRIDGFLIWFDIFFSPSPETPPPDLYVTPTEWCSKSRNYGFTTGPLGQEMNQSWDLR
ncbi:protein arginine N-methyltransferase [Ophiocordyceps camponoti-floridani]|uniref:type I protein arginine methyltransferase n=1 Tax=Ophiocordyceps camponoti-floridani TaxID=2030778 RepID=A0A8H4Q980_9HYPO|nr:protein arginine N-methyltransferase [Ophiocordyceps camponoti-floridani]